MHVPMATSKVEIDFITNENKKISDMENIVSILSIIVVDMILLDSYN